MIERPNWEAYLASVNDLQPPDRILFKCGAKTCEDMTLFYDLASALLANKQGEIDNLKGQGTIYRRLSGLLDWAKEKGIYKGIEAKPGELFIEEHIEKLEARIAHLEEGLRKIKDEADFTTDSQSYLLNRRGISWAYDIAKEYLEEKSHD